LAFSQLEPLERRLGLKRQIPSKVRNWEGPFSLPKIWKVKVGPFGSQFFLVFGKGIF